MTEQHQAAPELWAAAEKWGANTMDMANCLLELRDRIEALEAAQQPPRDKLDRLIAMDRDDPTSSLVEPVAPTDEELEQFLFDNYRSAIEFACDTKAEGDIVVDNHIAFARAALARYGTPAIQPVSVSERLPEPSVKVLAHYLNALGKGRTICAIWVPAKSRSDEGDLDADDFLEYDEESDKYHWPEGWYEAIENWEELGWAKVYEGEIAYWQPLPQWPANALPTPDTTNQEDSK